jgi:hypothetical protein
MKKWNTIKAINTLHILNANITNPILFETYIRKPELLEYHEQNQKFLEPI